MLSKAYFRYLKYILIFFVSYSYCEPELIPKGLVTSIYNNDRYPLNQFLAKNQDNIKARNFFWQTPLHLCALEGQLDLVKICIEERRAEVDSIDRDGNTPLITAAQYGYDDIVAYLLKKGANKKIKNNLGETAFDAAQNETAVTYEGPFKKVVDLLK